MCVYIIHKYEHMPALGQLVGVYIYMITYRVLELSVPGYNQVLLVIQRGAVPLHILTLLERWTPPGGVSPAFLVCP